MQSQIKTTTVQVNVERVQLDLSISEAHFILNLLGSSRPSIDEAHGLSGSIVGGMFLNLHRTLGSPRQGLYPRINISLQERL